MRNRKLLLCLSLMISFICSKAYAQKTDTIINELVHLRVERIFLNSRKEKRYYKRNPRATTVTVSINTCVLSTNVDVFVYNDSINRSIEESLTPFCVTNENDSILLSQFVLYKYSIDSFCLEMEYLGRDYYEITLHESGSIDTINHVRASGCPKQPNAVEQILVLIKSIYFKGEGHKSFFISINNTMTCSSKNIERPI